MISTTGQSLPQIPADLHDRGNSPRPRVTPMLNSQSNLTCNSVVMDSNEFQTCHFFRGWLTVTPDILRNEQ